VWYTPSTAAPQPVEIPADPLVAEGVRTRRLLFREQILGLDRAAECFITVQVMSMKAGVEPADLDVIRFVIEGQMADLDRTELDRQLVDGIVSRARAYIEG
jgi:hypothetical protein